MGSRRARRASCSGAAALVLIPGNLLFRRWVDDHGRTLLVALALGAAVTVAVLGAFRVVHVVQPRRVLGTRVSGRRTDPRRCRRRARPRSRAGPRRHRYPHRRAAARLLPGRRRGRARPGGRRVSSSRARPLGALRRRHRPSSASRRRSKSAAATTLTSWRSPAPHARHSRCGSALWRRACRRSQSARMRRADASFPRRSPLSERRSSGTATASCTPSRSGA